MNINRREFLKRGGLLALVGALPKAVTVGVDAAKEHVLKVYHRHVNVPVDAPRFDKQSGVPFVDFLLSLDHPRQRLACSCEYSLDGKCLHACEEGDALIRDVVGEAVDLFAVIAKYVDGDDLVEVQSAWQEYRNAENAYRRHYCTGWVIGEGDEITKD